LSTISTFLRRPPCTILKCLIATKSYQKCSAFSSFYAFHHVHHIHVVHCVCHVHHVHLGYTEVSSSSFNCHKVFCRVHSKLVSHSVVREITECTLHSVISRTTSLLKTSKLSYYIDLEYNRIILKMYTHLKFIIPMIIIIFSCDQAALVKAFSLTPSLPPCRKEFSKSET
jgi:hypothetical protein